MLLWKSAMFLDKATTLVAFFRLPRETKPRFSFLFLSDQATIDRRFYGRTCQEIGSGEADYRLRACV